MYWYHKYYATSGKHSRRKVHSDIATIGCTYLQNLTETRATHAGLRTTEIIYFAMITLYRLAKSIKEGYKKQWRIQSWSQGGFRTSQMLEAGEGRWQ